MNIKEVKLFNPNFIIKDWCYENLKSPQDIQYYQFYNKEKYHNEYLIPLNKVVGTKHQSYIGRKWIDLVRKMKRFKEYYTSENFIEYLYFNPSSISNWGYAKYGDEYIIVEGNHRTCEAKFSNLEYVKTYLVEYILDEEMLELYKYLIEIGLSPVIDEGEKNKIYNRNSAWKIFINNEMYTFFGFLAIQKFVKIYKETSISFINHLKSIFFDISKIDKFYKEKDDYTKLKSIIIRHKINI